MHYMKLQSLEDEYFTAFLLDFLCLLSVLHYWFIISFNKLLPFFFILALEYDIREDEK